MKSTEKEFLGRIAEAMKVRGYAFTPAAREATQQAIAEAGLEFAPEPVTLPELLAGGPAADCRGPFNIHLFPAELVAWESREQAAASYRAAVDRYNAYPGLRAAAAALLDDYRGRRPGQDRYEPVAALEAELAKGPK